MTDDDTPPPPHPVLTWRLVTALLILSFILGAALAWVLS